jgi:hypothetical protein
MKDLTPKDKAKELVNQFTELGLYIYTAKQCAIIAVRELIEEAREYGDDNHRQDRLIYLGNLKSEIEKL